MKSKVWCFVFGVLLCGQVAWGADRVKLELVGEVQLPVPKSIAVDGTYAYVGVDQGINKEAPHILYVINVETSNKPQVIASLPVRLSVDDIALQNGFAYLVGQAYQETEQGLSVVDVRDPEHPNVVGRYDTAFSGYYQHASVAVRGTRCYMALGHLFVLDTSDPSEPILLETVDPDVFYEGVRDPYPQSSFVSCLWTDENEAYLGLFFHGFGPDQDCAEPAVQRITLTSPIAGIGHVLSTEAVVRGITKVGGHMVCAMDSTVLLLDSQLDTPRVVGKCPRTTIWSGVEAYQNHAFFGGMANAHSDLGNNVDRVEVLDVSDAVPPICWTGTNPVERDKTRE
jgi:hypothetical protein